MKIKTVGFSFLKIFLILILTEGFVFMLMIGFMMTDEPIGSFAKLLYWITQYIIGFPLVLYDDQMPFFLTSAKPPSYMTWLILLNICIQTAIFHTIKTLIKNVVN